MTQTNKMFKYPQQKQKSGRVVYGTLTAPEKFSYIGDAAEETKILDYLESTSKSFLWAFLGQEKHVSGKIHYHYVVKYKSVVRSRLCDKMYEWFHAWSGAKSDRIIFGNGAVANMIGYCAKDGTYQTRGEIGKLNLTGILERYQKKEEVKQSNEYEGLTTRKSVLAETEIIQWLNTFMNSKGYKVNYHTRKLKGITKKKFFQELHGANFPHLFGRRGLKLAEALIEEDIHYSLPMWEPNLHYVKFKDGYWNMQRGTKISLDAGDKKGIIPVRIYDKELKGKLPELFLGMIDRLGWDVDRFKESYGRQFKDKTRRGKGLLIHGPPMCGKSTILIPYMDVFRDVVGDWADDGSFSLSSIHKHTKVISDEVNIFDRKYGHNNIKRLLEGLPFKAKSKHSLPVEVTPKTMMISTNDQPPPPENSHHIQAIHDRLDIYAAKIRLKPGEAKMSMSDRITDEAPYVMVWATRQIRLPPPPPPVEKEAKECAK